MLGSGDYAVGLATGTSGGQSSGSGSAGGSGGAPSGSSAVSGVTASSGVSASGTGGAEMHVVAVKPDTTTLLARTTQTLAATLDGVPTMNVTWSVVEPGGGTISAAGAYTAPTMEGTYHVVATSTATKTDAAQATITVKRLLTPTPITPAGTVVFATGNGTQSHLAYAANLGVWGLFHDVAGSPTLSTLYTSDFVSWQPGDAVSLPKGHTGDGRDLSVASRSINGHDVVHITQGFLSNGSYGRYHIRAVAANGHLVFDPPKEINSGGDTAPDGAATIILPDGTVLDSTGWEATPSTPPLGPCGNGDVDVYVASSKEDGVASFANVGFDEQVLWCVGSHVNARQLLSVDQTVFHLYEDGQSDASPVNILSSRRKVNGAWLPDQQPAGPVVIPPSVFNGDKPSGLDDWTGASAGGTIHVVRRLGGTFESRVFSAGNVWLDGAPIPAESTLGDSGLFLAPYGDGLILVALGAPDGNKIRYTAFDGAAWSDWTTLTDVPASRRSLSGFAPPPPARPALVWTEKLAGATSIVGVLLP